jgi:hypothetical protein
MCYNKGCDRKGPWPILTYYYFRRIFTSYNVFDWVNSVGLSYDRLRPLAFSYTKSATEETDSLVWTDETFQKAQNNL